MGWHVCGRWTKFAGMPCPFRRFDDDDEDRDEEEEDSFLHPVPRRQAARISLPRGVLQEKALVTAFLDEARVNIFDVHSPGVSAVAGNRQIRVPAKPAEITLPAPRMFVWPRSVPHGFREPVPYPVKAMEATAAVDPGVAIREAAWRNTVAEALAGMYASIWTVVSAGILSAALGAAGERWSSPGIGERAITQDYAKQMQLRPYAAGDRIVGGSGGSLFPADKFAYIRKKKFRWNQEWSDYQRNVLANQPGERFPLLPRPGLSPQPHVPH